MAHPACLPDDVWKLVLLELYGTFSLGALAALASTNRYLYSLATPELYKELVMDSLRSRKELLEAVAKLVEADDGVSHCGISPMHVGYNALLQFRA